MSFEVDAPLLLLEAYRGGLSPEREPVDGDLLAAARSGPPGMVGMIVVPSDDTVFCLVGGASGDDVRAFAARHDLIPVRIVAARWLRADSPAPAQGAASEPGRSEVG